MIIAMYLCSALVVYMQNDIPDWLYWVFYIMQLICLTTANISWHSMKNKVESLEKALERGEGK